jgi:hypothetical protein
MFFEVFYIKVLNTFIILLVYEIGPTDIRHVDLLPPAELSKRLLILLRDGLFD